MAFRERGDRDAYLLASHCSPIAKRPEAGFQALTREVLEGLVADGGAEAISEAGSLWFGNCFMGAWGQENVRGQAALVELVGEQRLPTRLPVVNVEAACATGSLAFHGAVKEIRAGECDVALAIGVEKLTRPPGPEADAAARTMALFDGCADQLSGSRFRETYREAAAKVGKSDIFGPGRSVFMDTYATQAMLHMQLYGTTRDQLAFGCAKNHNYGAANPLAQYRFETTVTDVLADYEVSYPLTRSMCSPIGDGAAGAVLCSAAWLRSQPQDVRERAIRVAGIGAAGGTYSRRADEDSLSREAADRAYVQSGLHPAQIDVAEVHDATSFGEVLQVEMLGFCGVGEGGPFVASGATGPGGEIPINTSGGLVSKGHPVGATGLSMIHELAVQLRGEAGARQVQEARVGLAENGGGVIGLEEAACAVTILEATR